MRYRSGKKEVACEWPLVMSLMRWLVNGYMSEGGCLAYDALRVEHEAVDCVHHHHHPVRHPHRRRHLPRPSPSKAHAAPLQPLFRANSHSCSSHTATRANSGSCNQQLVQAAALTAAVSSSRMTVVFINRPFGLGTPI